MKYSKQKMKQVEEIFKAQGYTIRYEKGNFHSGFCLVKLKKIIIINKFFQPSARYECLLNIAESLQREEEELSNTVFDIPIEASIPEIVAVS